MLTAKQHELLLYIQRKLEETGISPSFEEMKDALDLKSKSGVHRLISALEERGFLRRLPNRARALEVLRQPENVTAAARRRRQRHRCVAAHPAARAPEPANDVIEIPLHGRIAAGVPIEALESRSHAAGPGRAARPGDHYALEVSGDSMIEAGILDGDYALVKRTEPRATARSSSRWCATRKRRSSTCGARTG
jgi:repressor LexA